VCETPCSRNYEESVPIRSNIEKVNALFDQGHDIVHWTARECKSKKDYSELTLRQLNEWGCRFTRLEKDDRKPNYDILIGDKAINSIFGWDSDSVKNVYDAHSDEVR
jgi:hypothetical protein